MSIVERLLWSRRASSWPLAYNQPVLPSDISSCELWLTADAITGLSDGDSVSTWPDSSANGNDYSQGTAANQPTWQTNELNSTHPVVRFDATNDGMTGSASLSLPCSVLVIAKRANATQSFRRVVQGASNNWLMGPYGNLWRLYDGSALRSAADNRADYWSYAFFCASMQTGVIRLWTYTLDDNYTNLQNIKGTNEIAATSVAPGTLALGASGAFNEPAESDVADVAAFSKALSENEVERLYVGFRDKYGIT